MSLSETTVKENKCPVCHGYLFEEDDVVCCPICGAPHHRECWNSLSHCALQADHGTDREYDVVRRREQEEQKQKAAKVPFPEKGDGPKNGFPQFQPGSEASDVRVECPRCHEVYPLTQPACPKCGLPNMMARGFSVPDPLGGVSQNTPFADGVTAGEAEQFVLSSSGYYLPLFAAFQKGKKVAFDLWALLFPTARFAFRKMNLYALLCGLIEIAATLCMLPLQVFMQKNELIRANDVYAYLSDSSHMTPQLIRLSLLALSGMMLMLVLRILCALFFSRIYYRCTTRKIAEIKKESSGDAEEIRDACRRSGNVSFFGFFLALMAVQYFPVILFSLF